MKWVQFSNLHVDVPKDLTKPTVCTPYFLAQGAAFAINFLHYFIWGRSPNTSRLKKHFVLEYWQIVCLSKIFANIPGCSCSLQGVKVSSKEINYLTHITVGTSSLLLLTQHDVKSCHD